MLLYIHIVIGPHHQDPGLPFYKKSVFVRISDIYVIDNLPGITPDKSTRRIIEDAITLQVGHVS